MSILNNTDIDQLILHYMGDEWLKTTNVRSMLDQAAHVAVMRSKSVEYGATHNEPTIWQDPNPIPKTKTVLHVEELMEAILISTNQNGYISLSLFVAQLEELLKK